MAHNLKQNPFAALFGTVKDAEQYSQQIKKNTENDSSPSVIMPGKMQSQPCDLEMKTSQLEKLLLVSTREPSQNFTCIYMEDTLHLDYESVDIILFERLLLKDVSGHVRNLKAHPKLKEEKLEVVARTEVVAYLFDVYERCWHYRSFEDKIIKYVQSSVLTNLATSLKQPEIFSDQKIDKQLCDLILTNLPGSSCFTHMITQLLDNNKEEEWSFQAVFEQALLEARIRLEASSLMGVDWAMVDLLDYYASSDFLAPLLLSSKSLARGRQCQSTILGSLLSISCLPKGLGSQKYEFFEKPASQGPQVHKATEQSIGVAQKTLNNRVYKLFMTLLKGSPKVKNYLLTWIECCLESNAGRAGEWYIHAGDIQNASFVCDGFMLNLGAVLLNLASPFTRDIVQNQNKNYKILKVDAMYCSPRVARRRDTIKGVYSGDLSKQTTIVPRAEDDATEEEEDAKELLPTHFSFTTSCFFLTHRALHLGLQVIHQKIFKMSRDLGRLQHEYREVSDQSSPATEMMWKLMEGKTTAFLSHKAAAFEPDLVDRMLEFFAATSLWLVQVALTPERTPRDSALSYREVSLADLSRESAPPSRLRDVPEFLAENVAKALIAVRRYASASVSVGEPLLGAYMAFVTVFMGSPRRMSNPHLRAHLAECLETLIPSSEKEDGGLRERLFGEHPLRDYLVTAIISVFVSIEVTGQSVAFEEKLNYRRPMYEVMKYLWSVPAQRRHFAGLAAHALAHMESAHPPLFLRFVNLLMNDAIFLLDEGLSCMAQIRESQLQRDAGEWTALSTEQRGERARNMQENVFLAKFHNMLGTKTIQTLVMLTKEIPAMFTHATLIDRMAAMLNHFLAHLVGPKQKNLKVRDMEKYEFRPSEIVFDICSIYAHLSKESEFCVAVARDDRSYSPQLFVQASNVLVRIGRYELSQALTSFSGTVEEAGRERATTEDEAATAPDEFVDPITLHLMRDPVTLPSSRIIVDRQTIARHLLSDQTDPFNRQPLTMEQIIAEGGLKKRIQEWLEKKAASRASKKE